MRKPEEIVKRYKNFIVAATEEEVVRVIRQIQVEAIEESTQRFLDNVEIDIDYDEFDNHIIPYINEKSVIYAAAQLKKELE